MRMTPLATRDAVGLGLAGDVDHVRLALRVEMGQRRAVIGAKQCGNVRRGIIAARIRAGVVARRRHIADALVSQPRFVSPARRHAARRSALRRVAVAPPSRCCWPVAPVPAFAQSQLPALGDTESTTSPSAPSASSATRSCARSGAIPTTSTTRCCSSTCSRIWQPLRRQRARRAATLPPTSTSASPGSLSWCATAASTRSRCPGGYIGVHLGLIAMTATRDELASVLAHELSHITQRHIARSIASSKRQSLLGTGGDAARRARGQPQPAAPTPPTRRSSAARPPPIQGQLNFSRDMEREADRVGFAVMTGAGFAPGGMAAMFEKLDQRLAPQRQRRLPLPAQPPADDRAHRRGAGPRSAPRPRRRQPRQRARAHGDAGARARADGHARSTRCGAGRRGTPIVSRPPCPKSCCARTPARWRRRCCATGARADAADRQRAGAWCAARRRRARAPSAPSCCCRRSRCWRAAPRARGRRRRCSPMPPTARGRCCCCGAQIALAATPARCGRQRCPARQRAPTLQTWVAVHPHRFARLGRARPGLGAARPAAALVARRCRVALRARRPARRRRPPARRPAPGAQRRGRCDFIEPR